MDLDMDLRDDLGNQSDDPSGDGEGVWSPDIEQCFREALLLFPPCGRRKHILQEEGGGKMYGRNELIARHIMMRTGKRRTRKQVSSHIQVLARRKAKADAGGASGSSAGVSPSPSNNMGNNLGIVARPHHTNNVGNLNNLSPVITGNQPIGTNNRLNEANQQQQPNQYDVWLDRPIVTQKIRLVEFSAFVEYNSASHQFSQQQAEVQMVPDLNIHHQQQNIEGPQMTHLQPHALGPNGHHQQQQNYQLPLTSNHHLPGQFNNINSYQAPNQANNLVHAQKLSITGNSNSSIVSQTSGPSHHLNHQALQMQQQPQQTQHQLASAGSTRHSYIKINYTQQPSRQVNKLERIDINQIQDKFPEISGPDGLFQRGPPDAFFLVKFWADLNNDYEYNINDQNSFFGFSSHFETIDSYRVITCSTKACSYGLQVIEKVEKIYGCFNNVNGRYSYDMNRSPMCEFMIHFIRKLRQLPQASQMNSVLENFTVLQVITSESTSEILLCLAYVFEVAMEGHITGPKYNVYKLTKD